MRTSSRSSWCAGALVLAIGMPHALAQPKPDTSVSISLYDEGRRLFDAKQYDLACPKFDASLQLDPEDIDVRGMLALCHERAGKFASAWAQFREVRVRAQRANRLDPARVAESHIAALEPRLAKVTIRVSATPGLVVLRDGVTVPSSAFGSELAVDAGSSTFTAEAKGYQPWTTEIVIKDGETQTVDVPTLVAVPSVTREIEAPMLATVVSRPLLTTPRWVAVGLAGAGLLGLGVGTWAGLDARASRDDAHALGCNNDLSMCPPVALGTANAAYSRGNISTGFFIGGGALVATAVVVWFVARPQKRPATVQVQPSLNETSVGLSIVGDL